MGFDQFVIVSKISGKWGKTIANFCINVWLMQHVYYWQDWFCVTVAAYDNKSFNFDCIDFKTC